MSRVQTLQRRNIVLGLLAVGLAAYMLARPSKQSSVAKENFPRIAPNVSDADISRIELSEQAVDGSSPDKEKRVVLQRESDGSWIVESAFRYPALKAQVQGVLDALVGARNRGLVTTNKETFAKYASTSGWTHVRAMKSGGDVITDFSLGRDDRYPDAFLRMEVDGAEQIVRTRGVPRHVVTLDVADWISRSVWEPTEKAETIRLDIDQRLDKRVVTIVRRGESPVDVEVDAPEKDEADTSKVYWMASPAEGDVDTNRVNNLAQTLSGLLIENIAAGSASDEDLKSFGLDAPELVITLKQRVDKRIHVRTLYVGKSVKDEGSDETPDGSTKGHRYVRCDGKDYVFVVRGNHGVNEFRLDPLDLLLKKKEPEKDDKPNDGESEDGESKDDDSKDGESGNGDAKDREKESEKAPK